MRADSVSAKAPFYRIFFLAVVFLPLLPMDTVFAQASAKQPVISATVTRSKIISTYRSPKNSTRARRRSTQFIILHTTEGSVKGAIQKLSENGECHYLVDTDGKLYSIIDRAKIAYHAGLSMWNGLTELDSCSIGIEIVGYHNKDITSAQYTALKTLLNELKGIYKIPDQNVLTHSMVAYGTPNRWQKKSHRGRKRCAMLLALPAARKKLGLTKKPEYDPDVRAKRLVDADPELSSILYRKDPIVENEVAKISSKIIESDSNVIGPQRSAWDIARDLYSSPDTIYIYPDGTRKTGAEITNWKSMKPGIRVEIGSTAENPTDALKVIGKDGTIFEIAGDEATLSTTFYFTPNSDVKYRHGSVMTYDEIELLPEGTKVLVGYKAEGPIRPKLPVFNICGVKWNRPDTYYMDKNGNLTSGDKINEKNIPLDAMVFYRL